MPEPDQCSAPQAAARLVLEDGSVFVGVGFGAVGRGIAQAAEVVFNTAMTGYQESLTDPSYAGQILVMTAPLIGNTGVNREDVESARVQVAGFVVRELAREHSNYRADGDLSSYLADAGILGLTGVDTRAITRKLRVRGVMRGIITDEARLTNAELLAAVLAAAPMAGQNLVSRVGCTSGQTWHEALGPWAHLAGPDAGHDGAPGSRRPLTVLAIDCGAKSNILRSLVERGCRVEVIPHTTSAAEIRARFKAGDAHGLFISNGPGDPEAVEQTILTLRSLLEPAAGPVIPTFGICLGHQLIALALGAKTYKLKFGHRGTNQPVLNLVNQRVEITSQNHGFAVEGDSLRGIGAEATHVNLNDGTLAGFRLTQRPVFAVQYHPEASPGPHESAYLFDAFVRMMRTGLPVLPARSTPSQPDPAPGSRGVSVSPVA